MSFFPDVFNISDPCRSFAREDTIHSCVCSLTDDELLQSPFDNITVIDPPPQAGRHSRFNPATRTSTTQTVNLVTQSIGTSTCSFDSRTDEVSRFESLLRATCTNSDTSLLPFLIHTFEEVTQGNPIQ
ncbi:hypothetical protein P5673_011400 [Acropora cervicornis]|uniref:Uncharacterized protein n=1 Tax=Acropora cervicornis TaxID=6130 RepID=A0AAD9QP36_ACRCE|nr:hypothetical protein P5673_011400 [Acropora cervicornis]